MDLETKVDRLTDVTRDLVSVHQDLLVRDEATIKAQKRAAILGGVRGDFDDAYDGPHFLKALADWKLNGNYEAAQAAKAILGTSAATDAG